MSAITSTTPDSAFAKLPAHEGLFGRAEVDADTLEGLVILRSRAYPIAASPDEWAYVRSKLTPEEARALARLLNVQAAIADSIRAQEASKSRFVHPAQPIQPEEVESLLADEEEEGPPDYGRWGPPPEEPGDADEYGPVRPFNPYLDQTPAGSQR